MSTWIGIILLIAIIFVFSVLYTRTKKSSSNVEEGPEIICKNCQHVIPKGYTKSLCPHCNKLLV
ncbi:hypothetical protein BKP45_10910 [Anaerobacillus alkalidiazotrophicus]|uniref:Uncharacterized protein n=1 Tax=Anaerobacillus alkalidiazotrophicus TaxID=472963 RepID=A0A1S2M4C5_9BACI|nr:hypothetical protein [Anaerobacillus alkalidiazotrophicus]OIJ18099.1 hypothetical protein BKP45_16625 [Anaerobacillus alkalidiazotrophicus]OIJ19578.1 hypothetical protein BKP45_10910 [Anaerobacillus alkalidiazotrophicus]